MSHRLPAPDGPSSKWKEIVSVCFGADGTSAAHRKVNVVIARSPAAAGRRSNLHYLQSILLMAIASLWGCRPSARNDMVQVFQQPLNGGPLVGEPTAYVGRRVNGGLVQLLQVGALVVEVQDGVVGDAFGGHAARAHLAHADAVTVPATGEDHLKNIAVGVALEVDGEIG